MTGDQLHQLAEGTHAAVFRQAVMEWQPRPMPAGWRPLRPFTTEDGHGDPVTVPSWVPRFKTEATTSIETTRLDPLL